MSELIQIDLGAEHPFYAYNPSLNPIPNGTVLFCAKKDGGKLSSLDIQYDIQSRQNGCQYFLAYTEAIPLTTPLYLHKTTKGVVPSFKPQPLESLMPPVMYVFLQKPTHYSVINGRCIPDPSGKFTSVVECSKQGSNFGAYIVDTLVPKQTPSAHFWIIWIPAMFLVILLLIIFAITTKNGEQR